MHFRQSKKIREAASLPRAEWVEKLETESLPSGQSPVEISLKGVQVINSSELAALIRAHLELSKLDRSLRLVDVSGSVAEVLRLTRLDRLVSFSEEPARSPVPQSASKLGMGAAWLGGMLRT